MSKGWVVEEVRQAEAEGAMAAGHSIAGASTNK